VCVCVRKKEIEMEMNPYICCHDSLSFEKRLLFINLRSQKLHLYYKLIESVLSESFIELATSENISKGTFANAVRFKHHNAKALNKLTCHQIS